jgi:hypothetical protein
MTVSLYNGTCRRNPAGLADNVARVLRGGAYNNEGANLRCAYRNRNNPNNRNNNIGFRCVVCASFMLLMWKTHGSCACMFRSEMRLIHG